MREVGVLEAKTHLSALLDAVEQAGEEITITRHGKAIARLTPPAPKQLQARKLSGPELAEAFRTLREEIARNHPETDPMSWEELKDIARR